MNVFELDPGRGGQAVAPPLRALQVHSWPASSRSARSRRSNVGLPERRVESGAKLVCIEFAALLLVPFGKPLFTQCAKFFLRERAVPVLIALLQKSWRDEHRWSEGSGTARPTKTARTAAAAEKSSPGFLAPHRLPLFLRKLEVHSPDIRTPEQFGRARQSLAGFGRAGDEAGETDQNNPRHG